MRRATAQFFWPRPLGPFGGAKKVKYHYISIAKPISKNFHQTLCVFLQMKDIKSFRRDFHSVAWVMPRGVTCGGGTGSGGQKFIFFPNSTKFGV